VHNQINEAEPSWPGTNIVVSQYSYGVGKWRLIQKDDVCGPVLANRSNFEGAIGSTQIGSCHNRILEMLMLELPETFASSWFRTNGAT